MQTAFDFGAAADIHRIRDVLAARHGRLHLAERLDPLCQLVRSLLGSRTLDETSGRVFEELRRRFPCWTALLSATPDEIEAAITDVTFAKDKARHLSQALQMIAARHPDFDLDFLADWPLDAALDWLARLPGVGPKVAAATLNFSTLDRRVFVADTHVLRVLRRYGIIDRKVNAWRAQDAIIEATEGWRSFDLIELHALIKRHGQTTCRFGAPRCGDCPLARDCRKIK